MRPFSSLNSLNPIVCRITSIISLFSSSNIRKTLYKFGSSALHNFILFKENLISNSFCSCIFSVCKISIFSWELTFAQIFPLGSLELSEQINFNSASL